MDPQQCPLSMPDLAIVEEEEQLLARARESIHSVRVLAAQKAQPGDLYSRSSLRTLRDEAAQAPEDDLPGLLHELSVRQQLLARPVDPLPDPDVPYLAHLKLREGRQTKDYLLGHVSHLDPATGIRIVDWRVAPVAQIFYRYREGDEYEEEFPGRLAEGVVVARRILVIEGGKLKLILADGAVLRRQPQGSWFREDPQAVSLEARGENLAVRGGDLGVGAGAEGRSAPRDVTALLDPEQYEAICAPPDQPLLVLGSAGSGKTTVALHRLTRIAARNPEHYPFEQLGVVVPEEGLARLSRRLLDPLGAGATQVMTLDSWAVGLARQVFGAPLPRLTREAPGVVTSLKRHPALYRALRQHFRGLKPTHTTLRRLRKRLAEVFTDRQFLGQVVDASGGTLPHSAVEETVRHTLLQIAAPLSRTLADITAPELKRAVDGRPIDQGTPEELAGSLDFEDLPILLFLRAWKTEFDVPGFAHWVIDEAEDFSPFELFVLGSLLAEPKSVTLAGDEAQQTSSSFEDWTLSLETLLPPGGLGGPSGPPRRPPVVCRLSVSYRCPRPILEFAHTVLGPLARPDHTETARDGVAVGQLRFPDPHQATLFVAARVSELLLREPKASVAVILNSEDDAERFFPLVQHQTQARLVLDGAFSFEPGVDVTTLDAVKGLEFDYVVVADASATAFPATDDARRRLHVAATRAAHQLWVVCGGTPSPLLPPIPAGAGPSSPSP